MTTQHSDPPREPTDARSEVLSDATDLDSLLEALLGDEVAPVAAQGARAAEGAAPAIAPDAVTADATADAVTAPVLTVDVGPESAVVPPPLTAVDPEHAFDRGPTADDNDAWGFVREDPQQDNGIAPREFSTIPRTAPDSPEPPLSLRTWRDKLRVSLSKQWLLVAALSAAGLITASAIGLRDERTGMETLPSSEPPARVQASLPVQGTSAVRAIDSAEVEVWAAAREPVKQPRVMSRSPSRRTNEVTGERTNRPTKPAFVEAPRSAPPAPPVVASPALVEPATEPTDRDAAPSPAAISKVEQRTVNDSASTDGASSAKVVNAAAPAPTAAAPVAVAVPRRTAARLLTGAAPEYPLPLRTARIGGSVEVRFTIDSSGRVIKVQALTGHAQLRSAAEAAVKRWRYEAARLDNLAVETETTVRFNFDPSTDRRPQE